MSLRRQASFCAESDAPAAARAFVVGALAGVDPHARDRIELMVSELASNCVRHVGMRFDVAVSREGEEIRVEVTDQGYGTPCRRDAAPHETSGRGLAIVDLLARSWGVDDLDTGKTVWFVVEDRRVAPATSGRDAGHPLVDVADRHGSLADGRRAALDRARANVPGGEDPRHARLQEARRPGE